MRILLTFLFFIGLSTSYGQNSGGTLTKICIGNHGYDAVNDVFTTECNSYTEPLPIDPGIYPVDITFTATSTTFDLSTQASQPNYQQMTGHPLNPCEKDTGDGTEFYHNVQISAPPNVEFEFGTNLGNGLWEVELKFCCEAESINNKVIVGMNNTANFSQFSSSSSNDKSKGEIRIPIERTVRVSKKNIQSFYPNPVTDLITLDKSYNSIVVTNSNGQQLLSQNNMVNQTSKLDVSTLDAGMYYMILEKDGERKVESFVKL